MNNAHTSVCNGWAVRGLQALAEMANQSESTRMGTSSTDSTRINTTSGHLGDGVLVRERVAAVRVRHLLYLGCDLGTLPTTQSHHRPRGLHELHILVQPRERGALGGELLLRLPL